MGTLTTQISFFVVPKQSLGAGCARAESRTTSGKGKVMMIQHYHGIGTSYFDELREHIINPQKWDAEHFIVFDHEPGSGKTRQALRIIGEMTRNSDHRVLWVQLFSDKRKLLEATADEINEHAGKFVAVAVDGEDTRTTPKKQRVIGTQVLVITHRMYAQICKGEHKELIEDRDILSIDEFPNLMDEITISRRDLSLLFSHSVYLESRVLDEMLDMFRDKLRELRNKELMEPGHLIWGTFQSPEYQRYKTEINKLLKSKRAEECKELLQKFQQLFRHEHYYHNGVFYTYDNRYDYVLLKNNIILDANANFDYRYQLSKRFVVKPQGKVYNYSQSTFHHYTVNTGRTALRKCEGFFERVVETVKLQGRKGVLFVTDKENKPRLEQTIVECYRILGGTVDEIGKKLGTEIRVEYHGNLLGKNDWRTFDTVVIVKTPNFDYGTYALTVYFFRSLDKERSFRDIPIFRDEEVENTRNRMIAGELYQAIKRINRDNKQPSEIYLFCANEEAVGIVKRQLPGIKYVRQPWDMSLDSKRGKETGNDCAGKKDRVEELKTLILQYQATGVDSVQKKELREKMGYESQSTFAHKLSDLKSFFRDRGILNEGQRLIFNRQGVIQNESERASGVEQDVEELVMV